MCTGYGRLNDSPKMPVVNVGNKENPSYLPAEVCVVIPGQNSPKLSPTQTDMMTTFGCRPPWQNANMIVREGLETVGLLPTVNPHLVRTEVSISCKYGLTKIGAFQHIDGHGLDYGSRTYPGRTEDPILQ